MSKKKVKQKISIVPQPKEFRPLDYENQTSIAALCPNSTWAIAFLATMVDAGYAKIIRYLMHHHGKGIIEDEDMVHLCRAVRYSYQMRPSAL